MDLKRLIFSVFLRDISNLHHSLTQKEKNVITERKKLRNLSHLLEKSLMEKFSFCE